MPNNFYTLPAMMVYSYNTVISTDIIPVLTATRFYILSAAPEDIKLYFHVYLHVISKGLISSWSLLSWLHTACMSNYCTKLPIP